MVDTVNPELRPRTARRGKGIAKSPPRRRGSVGMEEMMRRKVVNGVRHCETGFSLAIYTEKERLLLQLPGVTTSHSALPKRTNTERGRR
jgi:hypothetical protein